MASASDATDDVRQQVLLQQITVYDDEDAFPVSNDLVPLTRISDTRRTKRLPESIRAKRLSGSVSIPRKDLHQSQLRARSQSASAKDNPKNISQDPIRKRRGSQDGFPKFNALSNLIMDNPEDKGTLNTVALGSKSVGRVQFTVDSAKHIHPAARRRQNSIGESDNDNDDGVTDQQTKLLAMKKRSTIAELEHMHEEQWSGSIVINQTYQDNAEVDSEVTKPTMVPEEDSTIYFFDSPESLIKASEAAATLFGEKNAGAIAFDNFNSAWYTRIDHKLDGPDMAKQMVQHMTDHLNYKFPSLIISVTGGAKNFDLPVEMKDVLSYGLRKAAENTNAWLVTGGTDCGIMAHVGEAMASMSQDVRIPVIGIATWGVIGARSELRQGGNHPNFSEDEKTASNVNGGVGLEPNHNVFFLYDDGTEGKFGREVGLLSRFENQLTCQPITNTTDTLDDDAIPKTYERPHHVLLVVEGGPVTLKVARQAVEARVPVVVIENSNRMADVIAYAWRYLNDTSPEGRYKTLSGLRSRIRKVQSQTDEEVLEAQQDVLNLVLMADQILIYSYEDDIKEDKIVDGVDFAILESLLNSMKVPIFSAKQHIRTNLLQAFKPRYAGFYEFFRRKFMLAKMFCKPDVARENLTLMRQLASENKLPNTTLAAEILRADMEKALMWGLENQNIEFIKMISPQVDLFNMLNSKSYEITHPPQTNLDVIFQPDKTAEARDYLTTLFKWTTKSSKNPDNIRPSQIVNKFIGALMLGTEIPRDHDFRIVGRSVHEDVSTGSNVPMHKRRQDRAYQDLLLWAVVINQFDLAKFFWRKGGNSISSALFASLLAQKLSAHPVLHRHGHFRELRAIWAKMSAYFEMAASGVLDECYKENSEHTIKLLRLPLDHLHLHNPRDRTHQKSKKYSDCMALAYHGYNLGFLSETACLALMEQEWWGDLDPQTGMGTMVITNLSLGLLLLQRSVFPVFFRPEVSNAESLSIQQRFFCFYHAPIVKYVSDFMSYMTLVVVFTVCVMQYPQVTAADDFATLELVLIGWMIAMTGEEIGQCCRDGLQAWFRSHWNPVDLVLYVLFWVGFWFRLAAQHPTPHQSSTDMLRTNKMVWAFAILVLYLRFFRYYYYWESVGPLITMISRMMKEVLSFLSVFLVLMVVYGVVVEIIKRPFIKPVDSLSGASAATAVSLVYHPYFQLYGELFLDEISQETECIGSTPFTGCGDSSHEIILILTAVYLFVTNIILVNLLIAMMTRQYDKVQANSLQVWRYNQFDLLLEYSEKSMVPHPLSLFGTFWKGFVRLRNRCRRVRRRPKDAARDRLLTELEVFQEKNTELFLIKEKETANLSTGRRIARVDTGTKQIQRSIEELQSQSQRLDTRLYATFEAVTEFHKGFASWVNNRKRRQRHLPDDGDCRNDDDDADDSDDDGDNDHDHDNVPAILFAERPYEYPKSPDRSFGFFKPDKDKLQSYLIGDFRLLYALKHPEVKTASDENLICLFESELTHFLDPATTDRERTLPRDSRGRLVTRQMVPEALRSWDVQWEPDTVCDEKGKPHWNKTYNPTDYTAPYVLHFGPHSPCTGFKWAHSHEVALEVSAGTIEAGVVPPQVSASIPLNPAGRTGLRGRGLLGKWGANLAIDQIVTRWKRNQDSGVQVERGGKPVLEVLLCKRVDNGQWGFPGGFPSKDPINPIIRKAFGLDDMDDMNTQEEYLEVLAILSSAAMVYKGPTCDARDTDNAWVESTMMHVHDDTNLLSSLPLIDGHDSRIKFVSWATIHKDIKLYANHAQVLGTVVDSMNAHW